MGSLHDPVYREIYDEYLQALEAYEKI